MSRISKPQCIASNIAALFQKENHAVVSKMLLGSGTLLVRLSIYRLL